MTSNMKKIVMILMAVALIALPTMAQQQEWKSTSTMQGAGSTLSPNVTTVGASSVSSMATTTETNSPAKAPGGPRKIGPTHGEDNPNPIGDAMLPLLLCALAFSGYIAIKRRKALNDKSI